MLRKRVFQVAAVAAAAMTLGGCSPTTVWTNFRSVELTPVASQSRVETVADLQVIGDKKVIGTAKGFVTSPEQLSGLRVKALEAAIASDPSGPDVLVAPNWVEVTEDKVNVTVTVIGYPARYKNFRRDYASAKNKAPFSVRQLPGGAAVVSYDKNAYAAELATDRIIAITAIQDGAAQGSAKTSAVPAAAAAKPDAPAAASTAEQTGE